MPKLRPVAATALTLALAGASSAHGSYPLLPLASLAATAALRSFHRAAAPSPAFDFGFTYTAPRRIPERRDLDDVVRDWIGGGATFYLGQNLARSDVSAVKTFGLKFFFQ